MSEYSLHTQWIASTTWGLACGVTAGDTMHLGLRQYWSPMPCPNGLPLLNTLPRDNAGHRARVDKARRDAAEWSALIDLREAAKAIPVEVILDDVKAIRKWARSLLPTQ